jgi:fused signal recognition particle receptor
MGLFSKIKQGLDKTRQLLKTDVRDLFKSQGRLVDDAFLEELSAILIKTDMGVQATEAIVAEVSERYRARVMQMDELLASVKAKLKQLMAQDEQPIRFASPGPTVIMVAGVNGVGKTTSIAKLAHLLIAQGKKVVLGAGDTFRAAAVEQLTFWANQLGAQIVRGEPGSDPASVAHRAVALTIESGADVCIIDTAGRLQTQQNLMQQLTKIHRVIGKQIAAAPHEVLLVLDATTGQNGISQARHFTDAVSCTGIVLAKLDGTAKGGVVGVGERPEDLTLFSPDDFVEALFDEVVAASAAR